MNVEPVKDATGHPADELGIVNPVIVKAIRQTLIVNSHIIFHRRQTPNASVLQETTVTPLLVHGVGELDLVGQWRAGECALGETG
jgi:hypothetical protein